MACCTCGPLTKEAWLRLVLIQAALLCAAQIYCGVVANSLALMSDAVHAVTDVFGYFIAYIAETVKTSSVVGKRDQRAKRVVDLAGFACSVTFIGMAAYYVTDAAAERISQRQLELLHGPAAALAEGAHAPGGVLHPVDARVILGFSAVATICNLVVASLYSDKSERALKGFPERKSKQTFMTRAHDMFHLHGANCGHEWGAAPQDEEINLNILVQWVHVVMDGLRGLLMLICSGLICMGWFDPTMTDAIMSIAVCVMVICGSLGLVPQAYKQLRAILDEDELGAMESAPLIQKFDERRPSKGKLASYQTKF